MTCVNVAIEPLQRQWISESISQGLGNRGVTGADRLLPAAPRHCGRQRSEQNRLHLHQQLFTRT
jgi:hypothetical protein